MHIEQLMMERDMDREETHNEALRYQKRINEVINQRQTSSTITDQFTGNDGLFPSHKLSEQQQQIERRTPLKDINPLNQNHCRLSLSVSVNGDETKPSSLVKHSSSNNSSRTTKRVWFRD